MKKIYLLILSIFLFINIGSVSCNMAAPDLNSENREVTFSKNEDISVLNETLNIDIYGDIAYINAIYTMKNESNKIINSESMFIAPNIESYETNISIDNNKVNFNKETYQIDYNSEIVVEDWKYVVLNPIENDTYFKNIIDVINFSINFKENEVKTVDISYYYKLGGRPNRIDNAKYGELVYYLTPASMWKSFSNLTINLKLPKELSVIERSTLKLDKIDNLTYQYKSDTLPDKNLVLKIVPTKIETFFATFNSPYILFYITPIIILSIILITLIVIIFIIRRLNKKRINK